MLIPLLLIATSAALAFELSVFVHHQNATEPAGDWRCVPLFENLTESFGALDETPYGVLLVAHNAPTNAACAGRCTPAASGGREWWSTNDLCNSTTTSPPVCYCVTDNKGGCGRGLTVASFSHEVTACQVAVARDRLNATRFALSLTLKDGAQDFQAYVHRGFTPGYTCQDSLSDQCTFAESCGAWHSVHNVHDVAGRTDSPCDSACVAKPAFCQSTVCWKSGTACLAGERILSTATKPTSCQIDVPSGSECLSGRAPFVDPFVRAPSAKLTVQPTNICCSGLPAPTTAPASGSTANTNGAAPSSASGGATDAPTTAAATSSAALATMSAMAVLASVPHLL